MAPVSLVFSFQATRSDILECLSVLINENNSGNVRRVEELTLDEQLLGSGATLTAVTLPDGTQAFVANTFNNDG